MSSRAPSRSSTVSRVSATWSTMKRLRVAIPAIVTVITSPLGPVELVANPLTPSCSAKFSSKIASSGARLATTSSEPSVQSRLATWPSVRGSIPPTVASLALDAISAGIRVVGETHADPVERRNLVGDLRRDRREAIGVDDRDVADELAIERVGERGPDRGGEDTDEDHQGDADHQCRWRWSWGLAAAAHSRASLPVTPRRRFPDRPAEHARDRAHEPVADHGQADEQQDQSEAEQLQRHLDVVGREQAERQQDGWPRRGSTR